ncbi:MAG: hypothetical protein IT285_04825 [Bdellovibrionales bacterium]|nr:hypothetical protein [Bdellovibrionales bacterium]
MKESWEKRIAALTEAVFRHELTEVRAEVTRIVARGRIPRAVAADLANCCRRADLPELSLTVLARYVRPNGKVPARPTDDELGEYAGALSQLGAHREAEKLLSGKSSKRSSTLHFVQGLIYQKLWDFDRSIAAFEVCLTHPNTNPRRGTTVVKVQLAASLIRARRDPERAAALLEEVLQVVSPTNLAYLHQMVLVFKAENELVRGNNAACIAEVAAVQRAYQDDRNPRHIAMGEALAALAALAQDPARSELAVRRVHMAQDRLRELRCWEESRAVALHEARIRKNRDLLLRLYFGSPFPELRRALLQELGGEENIPVHFDWYLSTRPLKPGEARYSVDVVSGAHSQGEGRLKTGQLLQRLLEAMGSDPFRRFRIGDLFDLVFPGEYYNPHTAPDRIHQAVMRLRRWFEDQNCPLAVAHEDGFYWLRSEIPITLRVTQVRELAAADAALLTNAELEEFMRQIDERFLGREFGPVDVADQLGLSRRSANRRIQEAVEAGLLERLGGGRSTRYRLGLGGKARVAANPLAA